LLQAMAIQWLQTCAALDEWGHCYWSACSWTCHGLKHEHCHHDHHGEKIDLGGEWSDSGEPLALAPTAWNE
jgi:hypothetical protein